jgi:hypothetical protein
MLSNNEIQAIEEVLINGGSKVDKETLVKLCDLLATLRHKFNCDNHELHRLYSMQNKEKENTNE